MQDDFRGFRRFPTAEKRIGDITPEDGRVGFIGTIIDRGEDRMMVDDGSGSIEALFEKETIKNFKKGDVVRIVGKISDGMVTGEALQDFTKFDLELYRKIKSIEGKSI